MSDPRTEIAFHVGMANALMRYEQANQMTTLPTGCAFISLGLLYLTLYVPAAAALVACFITGYLSVRASTAAHQQAIATLEAAGIDMSGAPKP